MCVPCSRCCVHALHTLYTSTVRGTFCYSPPSPPGKLSLSKVTYPRWARITRGQLTPGTWALTYNSWGTAVVLKSTPHCCQRVLSKLSSGLSVFLTQHFLQASSSGIQSSSSNRKLLPLLWEAAPPHLYWNLFPLVCFAVILIGALSTWNCGCA